MEKYLEQTMKYGKQNLKKTLKEIIINIKKLKDLRIHDLRHVFASKMVIRYFRQSGYKSQRLLFGRKCRFT